LVEWFLGRRIGRYCSFPIVKVVPEWDWPKLLPLPQAVTRVAALTVLHAGAAETTTV
jgi:hypothetical protein